MSKSSINVWSNCNDKDFHMNFVICVYPAISVVLPLLILPGKRLNRDIIGGCNIKGAKITTPLKGFINSKLLLSWLEFFTKSVPYSVASPLFLVYDGCFSHYNDKIVKNWSGLNLYWFFCHIMPPILFSHWI